MIKPIFNSKTGKYDVFVYCQNHEFDDKQKALDFVGDVVNDFFSDPIFITE
jgi:hypothetical protein